MSAWIWIVIAVAAVAVVAVVVWQAVARHRTGRLKGQFGPEYDRTVESTESRRDAEAELQARAERRRQLDIRPLPAASRIRYLEQWQVLQAQFVDDPHTAVASAASLIKYAMAERGYPVEDFDQRVADVSVDHPEIVEDYREGHRLAQAGANGDGSTEDLRQAMRRYRSLFDELVGQSTDQGEDAVPAGARSAR